jgi:hypothetical protein
VESTPNRTTVRLTVPAGLEHVRIVRLTASGVASGAGFDVEEIEDLRVAVDELASLLVDHADGGELEMIFETADGELKIEGGTTVRPGGLVRLDDLTAQILAAVTDKYDVVTNNGHARFTCVRRLPTV